MRIINNFRWIMRYRFNTSVPMAQRTFKHTSFSISIALIALFILIVVINISSAATSTTSTYRTSDIAVKKQFSSNNNNTKTNSNNIQQQHRNKHKHHHHNHHNHQRFHHHQKANRVKKSGNGASILTSHRIAPEIPLHALRERKPNIILILTDDQDVELGKCYNNFIFFFYDFNDIFNVRWHLNHKFISHSMYFIHICVYV